MRHHILPSCASSQFAQQRATPPHQRNRHLKPSISMPATSFFHRPLFPRALCSSFKDLFRGLLRPFLVFGSLFLLRFHPYRPASAPAFTRSHPSSVFPLFFINLFCLSLPFNPCFSVSFTLSQVMGGLFRTEQYFPPLHRLLRPGLCHLHWFQERVPLLTQHNSTRPAGPSSPVSD